MLLDVKRNKEEKRGGQQRGTREHKKRAGMDEMIR